MEEGWKRKRAEKLSPLTVVGETPRGERNVISRRFDGEPARHETFGCEHRERSLAPTSSNDDCCTLALVPPARLLLDTGPTAYGFGDRNGCGGGKEKGGNPPLKKPLEPFAATVEQRMEEGPEC